jgi:hypothetical protein
MNFAGGFAAGPHTKGGCGEKRHREAKDKFFDFKTPESSSCSHSSHGRSTGRNIYQVIHKNGGFFYLFLINIYELMNIDELTTQ